MSATTGSDARPTAGTAPPGGARPGAARSSASPARPDSGSPWQEGRPSGPAATSTRRVLVLGATGMLGHTLLRELSQDPALDVYGAARTLDGRAQLYPPDLVARITPAVDAGRLDQIRQLLDDVRPDVVVNGVGVIKQRPDVRDAVPTVTLNALFPHQLAELCARSGSRLVHISTDCVFSGARGGYVEDDLPDPPDLYGRSKLLGEPTTGRALTLRTSIVGHELTTSRSLLDWFLSQRGVVRGFTRAVYSGVTTVEFARLLREAVLPREDLTGLYHVAAAPISKHDLLRLVADVYGWPGQIVPDDTLVCDRSMRADALAAATGYRPLPWSEMIRLLHEARSRWTAPRPRTGRPAAPA